MDDTALTPKAERTRHHIFETALRLFAKQGYDATTMRDIAAAAECSLGLAYRYFARKEDLVLLLYQQMATETHAQIAALDAGKLADRFHAVMAHRLAEAAPYRDAVGALFGATMNPASDAGLLGDSAAHTRTQTHAAFMALVADASDAPKEAQVEPLATLLYSLHFLLILFWLYDRSPEQRATADLLAFVRDMLANLRVFLVIPMVSQSLNRLAAITAAVFVP
jgi:AcrR family transcriptional regulator